MQDECPYCGSEDINWDLIYDEETDDNYDVQYCNSCGKRIYDERL